MPKIIVDEISKFFKSETRGVIRALRNISFFVNNGEFVVLIGPSGCGKSTLLRIIDGLEKPTRGKVLIDNVPIENPSSNIGFVFQEHALFPWRTVRENIEFGLDMLNVDRSRRSSISGKYIKLFGLKEFEDRYPYELSAGMRQRVAILRALAYDPDILLMDEPFASVDALTREKLQIELLRIWKKTKKTIVFVTHDIEEAYLLADRMIILTPRPGRVSDIINIKFPRPRTRDFLSREFIDVRRRVWKSFQKEMV